MATTRKGRELTERHQQQQEWLLIQLARFITRLVHEFFSPDDIRESSAAVGMMGAERVLVLRKKSRELTLSYLEDFQRLENPLGIDLPDIEEGLTVESVAEDLAERARIAGLTATKKRLSYAERARAVEESVRGRASRIVADGGRETAMVHVSKGLGPIGYARVPDADPCPFCAMLASRGLYLLGEDAQGAGLYKTNSFDASNARFTGAGEFKVHDNCACTLEPVYSRAGVITLPGNGNQLAREWAEIASGRDDPWGAWERWRVSGTLPEEYDGDLVGVKRPRPEHPTRGRATGQRKAPKAETRRERARRKAQERGHAMKPRPERTKTELEEFLSEERSRLEGIRDEIEALSQSGLREDDPVVEALQDEEKTVLSIIADVEKKVAKM